MRTLTACVGALGCIAVATAAAWWLSSSEILKVRALETVPLFEPNSLAGTAGEKPLQVGQLAAGEEAQVLGCEDRKSDINLHAIHQGKAVVVGEWEAKVLLLRGHAYPWEPGATTSCHGFFASLSANA